MNTISGLHALFGAAPVAGRPGRLREPALRAGHPADHALAFATKLVGRYDLTVAICVAQMQRGSAGRYAIVLIAPEAGIGPQL